MKIEERVQDNYKYLTITLNSKEDSEILEKIKDKAKKDYIKVNPHYLDGSMCPKDLKYCNNLGGVLAEEVVKSYIRDLIKKHNLDCSIIEEDFVNHQEHRDIKIKLNGKIKTLEVRSSFNYLANLEGVLNGKFSLIGSYTTSYKGEEPEKDYYITVIHRYKNMEIINKIEKEVEVFIIGGASRELFKEIGKKDSRKFKQSGTEYLIISPINSVPGVTALFNKILEIKDGE